jgi:hypothetical protein
MKNQKKHRREYWSGTDPVIRAFIARSGSELDMQSAEYYVLLKKFEEYAQMAEKEPEILTKQALEALSREYLRRAEQLRSAKSGT